MWKLVITLEAPTLQEVKDLLFANQKTINKANVPNDLRTIVSYSSGASIHIDVSCPIEAEIKQLRDRADELERHLNAGKL